MAKLEREGVVTIRWEDFSKIGEGYRCYAKTQESDLWSIRRLQKDGSYFGMIHINSSNPPVICAVKGSLSEDENRMFQQLLGRIRKASPSERGDHHRLCTGGVG